MNTFEFFDVRNVMNEHPDCLYYLCYGERSSGKTFSSLDYSLERYFSTGEQFAYIRRFGEQIKQTFMMDLFSGILREKRIEKWSGGEWDGITFKMGKFYLTRTIEGETEVCKNPCGHAFGLNLMENYKSLEYPKIMTIIFDEFISRSIYLSNEFVLFQNMLSTIIRLRTGVKIIMLGNSVNRYSLYFTEMGLKQVKTQEPGTTDVYQYGDSGLKVACCYTDPAKKSGGKPSDIYFAFDNPALKMITEGGWEIGLYPHLTEDYLPMDVIADFFVEFDKELLHGEVIVNDNGAYIFFHIKTTPIKDEDGDIVYTTYAIEKWNYKMCLTRQGDKLSKFIMNAVRENKVFYSTNDVGEIFRNYLIWSDSYNVKN